MEANNLKISSDLQSYIKSVVHTELSIHESASAIPAYAMYAYNSMSTSSITPGAITIEGQDIVDYCEDMKMDLDTDTNLIQNQQADIADLKAKINSQVTEDEFEAYKEEVTEALDKKVDKTTLDDYAKKSDLIGYVKSETLNIYAKKADLDSYVKTSTLNDYATKTDLNDYVKTSTLSNYAKKTDLDNYISSTTFETYKSTMEQTIKSLEDRIAALENTT